ncbi:MAG: ATP-dependent 6-phosphofructokinase [Acidimicrobiia bacterium]|nr:ATP-dependent 6-phosphofructokinase [Acidimicrobiia bacterium]
MPSRTIGIITSGGDAPGMNPCVRAVVRMAAQSGHETIGVLGGYDGLLDGGFRELRPRDVGGILHLGGTVLHTGRCSRLSADAGAPEAVAAARAAGLDALVVIGGDGSLRGANALAGQGMDVIGIPASIDNDIWGTNMSLGVDTALNTILESVDKLRDTASSHRRTFLVETMGRESGYLAIMAGVISGAEIVVVPETDITPAEVVAAVHSAREREKAYSLVIVAEGAALGVDVVAEHLAEAGERFESRITRLGHVQRGGSPSAFDRLLAARFGVAAIEAIDDGATNLMVGLDGRSISRVGLDEVVSHRRSANLDYLEMAQDLAR